MFSKLNKYPHLIKIVSFSGGFVLGQIYYHCVLKKIPFPWHIGFAVPLVLSLLLGLGNIISTQIRCISLLLLPMYCGRAGRSVLKAVVLTYVVAGPITNMGLNAKEVVRVFACSTQLSYNLSKYKHQVISRPLRDAARSLGTEIEQAKDTLRSIQDVLEPIEYEISNMDVLPQSQLNNDYIDDMFQKPHRSDLIERKYKSSMPHSDHNTTITKKKLEEQEISDYQTRYLNKLENECERQLSHAVEFCLEIFTGAFDQCFNAMPRHVGLELCKPLELSNVCRILDTMRKDDLCDSTKHINSALGQGYVFLLKAKNELTKNLNDIKLQYKITNERILYDIQDTKETGERVQHAFEEKIITMDMMITIVNVCVAMLYLRIVVAAVAYHDMFLTGIDYDNVYITGYFKRLDKRRRMRNQITLLPLKKMERSKYIDVDSIAYVSPKRNKLVTQILKVMLEMITATTFVMLDRLFYEALDVVRQHAEADVSQDSTRDLVIEVEGTGIVASTIRKVIDAIKSRHDGVHNVSNKECVPHPSLMPPKYFIKIYGGYLWIILLLCVNPYTLRLRRLISSYIYPRREKQRILHLYNDILKKRMKMDKTLRRKAVQAVRAYYLSGENLLSMRIKFPRLLGWLRLIPVARMTCLICGQTEPRNNLFVTPRESWRSCPMINCPFVYCAECWREVGERCLACDPSLAELSDIDSLSEDEQPHY